ncbi:PEP-CTERM sorting domain-containing protein [Kiritimatiellota bacterium B12222]|nr:PEP-CTERM sorting domain-containing protein [Kiritimatiellota bacterium B12222]
MKTYSINAPHHRSLSQQWQRPQFALRNKGLILLGMGMLALLSSINPAQAALTILVSESEGDVVFSWNGIIGDSGTGTETESTFPSSDFIDPNNSNNTYAWSAADRSTTTVSGSAGNWEATFTYAGSTTSVYGTGGSNSGGTVSGGGLPFTLHDNGTLYVNTVTDSLDTSVFQGTYTFTGSTLSSLGLFNTLATATPLTFWEAATGDGSIQFVVVPEPSTLFLVGISLSLMVCFRRHRRS